VELANEIVRVLGLDAVGGEDGGREILERSPQNSEKIVR
jgi:hypothetical protein